MSNACQYDRIYFLHQRKWLGHIIVLPLCLVLLLAASWTFFLPATAHAQSTRQIQLEDLKMFDMRNGWALEKNGTHVLTTKHGPEHWSNVTPAGLTLPGNDSNNLLTSSFFLDARHGYLGALQNGKTSLWMTQNGGRTWKSVSFDFSPLTSIGIYQIEFLDARHGWLAFDKDHGFGHYHIVLMSTSDGGKSWQQLLDTTENPNGLPIQGPKSFHFTSARNGWVTGPAEGTMDVRLYKTHDGGKNWTEANVPPVSLPPPVTDPYTVSQGPFFRDAHHGILVVKFAALSSDTTFLTTYHTADGGHTWKPSSILSSTGTTTFREEMFLKASNGWVLGVNPKGMPVLQCTKDGGQHWQTTLPTGLHPFTEVILNLTFLNPLFGWTINKDDNGVITLFQTTDGGSHWQPLHPTIQ